MCSIDAGPSPAHPEPMHAVVIDRVQGDVATLAKAAADVLGVTAYDVRASMQVPGGGPSVLTVLGDRTRAEATREGLERAGFDARVVSVQPEAQQVDVRTFELGPHGLTVQTRGGTQTHLPYEDIRLLVRATAVTTQTKTKTMRERKFAPMRTVLSGGLVNTKVQTTKKTTHTTDSTELLYAFGSADTPVRMAEDTLLYQGLGPALQPSRTANFARLVQELRRRCPRAAFDERLRRRNVCSQILGRTLSPDDFMDLAVTLVASSVRDTTAPFRGV
jgi:hypothetical protein